LRARLGRAAQETVQSRFSLEQHIASCEALYAELLPSGHSKTRS